MKRPSNSSSAPSRPPDLNRQGYAIALDPAASEFYSKGKYDLKSEKKALSSEEMIRYYENRWTSIHCFDEDGLAEGDWKGWEILTDRLGGTVQIVGVDIFVTNSKIFRKGDRSRHRQFHLIKLNQIGTVTETLDTIEMAKSAGYTHRSFPIAPVKRRRLYCGLGGGHQRRADQNRILSRSDRHGQIHQLIRIEAELGSSVPSQKIFSNRHKTQPVK
jgi:enolase